MPGEVQGVEIVGELIEDVRRPSPERWSSGGVHARPIGWDPDGHDQGSDPGGGWQPLLFPARSRAGDDPTGEALEPAGAIHPDRVRDVARVVVEVMTARRPVAQISGWVTPAVLGRIVATRSRLAATPERSRPGPVRVATLRSSFLSRDALEVAVRVGVGDRQVAMAFQLRRRGCRWICTAWDHRLDDLLAPST